MVQFLRNHITFMPHSTKSVRKRILLFLIAPRHLTHPRSISLMRQPLTFPRKAHTEHAPGRELPTRGTNRPTEKKKHFTFLKTLFMVSAKTLPWLRAACPVSQGWHTYCTHGLWLTKTLQTECRNLFPPHSASLTGSQCVMNLAAPSA